jgi:hypothetical protein
MPTHISNATEIIPATASVFRRLSIITGEGNRDDDGEGGDLVGLEENGDETLLMMDLGRCFRCTFSNDRRPEQAIIIYDTRLA